MSNPTPQTAFTKNKAVAGVLGILLGGLGIHKFYLGYIGTGILELIITLVTCGAGALLGLIEGIIYLTQSDEQFAANHSSNSRPWF